MFRHTISLFLLLAGTAFYTLQAQTAFDALRFSYYPTPGGTARNMGAGGALSAFGADFATLSSNPAGLASYRRSEFSFSPEIFSVNTRSLLVGNDFNEIYNEARSSLNINNVGFVIASLPRASSWKTINFGIGLNRTATFTQSLFFAGASPGSITHRFVNKANGLEANQLDNFEEGLAYDVGAIYPDQFNPGSYLNDFGDLEEVNKSQIARTRGAINEMVFSLAANYEEKLQLGATIGVPILSYSEDKTYVENDPDNVNPIFNELIFQENVRVTGTGVNLKLGMIYKPIHAIRIGAAIHTPTAFSLDDSYSTRMTYDYTFNGNNRFTESSPEGFFEYRLRTPWRVIGSTGLLFNKSGFLTAEIEWADYSSAAFRFNNTNNPADKEYERELNREIQRNYQAAFIARFGGEVAIDVFRIRAGFNLINSPSSIESYTRGVGTVGFGVREKGFFLDIAYRIGLVGATYEPFQSTSELQPEVDLETTAQNFLMTLGFRF
jgi:hypothetical protein